MLLRASNVKALQRSTLLTKTSNMRDFDYLHIRKITNPKFHAVELVLASYKEQNQLVVFSENV